MFKLAVLAFLVGTSAIRLSEPPQTYQLDRSVEEEEEGLYPHEFDESENISHLSSSLGERLRAAYRNTPFLAAASRNTSFLAAASRNTSLSAASANVSEKEGRHAGQLVFYFIGDSLIRNQYQALCRVLTGGYQHVDHHRGLLCETPDIYATFGPRKNLDKDAVATVRASGEPPPDIIYVDGGLHTLHLHPVREATWHSLWGSIHFENDMRELLLAYGAAAPGAIIEVMTPLPVCEGNFNRAWADFIARVNNNSAEAAKPCADAFSEEFGEATAQRACESSFMNRAGSERLAMVIRKVVADLRPTLGDRLRLVDLWNITDGHCDLCKVEGRHYTPMILQQLAEFLRVNGW